MNEEPLISSLVEAPGKRVFKCSQRRAARAGIPRILLQPRGSASVSMTIISLAPAPHPIVCSLAGGQRQPRFGTPCASQEDGRVVTLQVGLIQIWLCSRHPSVTYLVASSAPGSCGGKAWLYTNVRFRHQTAFETNISDLLSDRQCRQRLGL